jgi:hypothetical protein
MQTTNYRFPTVINQVSAHDETVSWDDVNEVRIETVFSQTDLRLYNMPIRDALFRANMANQLWCTGFGFTGVGTVVGIELRLVTQRLARIQDYTIQLIFNGELVGENYANYMAENDQLYGGVDDLWGTSLTGADIMDGSFGVMVELGHNRSIPHADTGYIDAIEMRAYFY